ncbi:MAG TPA: FHA domain-containing protein [Anaerolineales bacterium]|nr:FHA domain-containing protein [Anaerolineales bacterium]
MRSFVAIIFAFIFSFSSFFNVSAQSSESIWLTAGGTEYKTGETFKVLVNAASVTPIQGFTFQIRYDPACLKPVNASSPISGMNGLSLPQTVGLVDASFASTVPQNVGGVLAEVTFQTLGGCQTNLILESAALAVRNSSGFAAPLPGITIGQNNIPLNIDSAVGVAQEQVLAGTPLPLDPTTGSPTTQTPIWGIALLTIGLILGLGFGIYKVVQKGMGSVQSQTPSQQPAVVKFKHGSNAGRSFSLKTLPFLIGSDADNDICLSDPSVLERHAQIYAANNRYYLMDLGGETFINGHAVRRSSAVLNAGDVVRLGRNTYFEFAS